MSPSDYSIVLLGLMWTVSVPTISYVFRGKRRNRQQVERHKITAIEQVAELRWSG